MGESVRIGRDGRGTLPGRARHGRAGDRRRPGRRPGDRTAELPGPVRHGTRRAGTRDFTENVAGEATFAGRWP